MNRRAAPIQGSTLPDVLLNGGALGKLTKVLSPQPSAPDAGKAPAAKGQSSKGKAPPGDKGSASQ